MHYFKRHWAESRGDEYDAWGTSDWWLETDAEGFVTRCLHVYANHNALFYSESHSEDRYGGLPEVALELAEFSEYRIEAAEFELAILSATPLNPAP